MFPLKNLACKGLMTPKYFVLPYYTDVLLFILDAL